LPPDDHAPQPDPSCPFCRRDTLQGILAGTASFIVLADHAPLVAGHLLIIPRAHYACYGAVPAALDDELLALKRRATAFLSARYRTPVFFEHGVFRQTVSHAHLHAIPAGGVSFGVAALAAAGEGRPVTSRGDVRAWYAERGPYFYLEEPARDDESPAAAVFPPHPETYFRVLGLLRDTAAHAEGWQPASERLASGRPKVATLIERWRDFGEC
jgi:diadenosine tetraphosphate (Ap4A) HIT family hydrolase